jgi:hypothetical protein
MGAITARTTAITSSNMHIPSTLIRELIATFTTGTVAVGMDLGLQILAARHIPLEAFSAVMVEGSAVMRSTRILPWVYCITRDHFAAGQIICWDFAQFLDTPSKHEL